MKQDTHRYLATDAILRWKILVLAAMLFMISLLTGQQMKYNNTTSDIGLQREIKLPSPVLKGTISVEEALSKRRSVRDYTKDSLDISEIAQLLWASQGITSPEGGRTAPSAGALYPLEIYLVSDHVKGLPVGVFHYHPAEHFLEQISSEHKQDELFRSALMQGSLNKGAAIIVIAAVFSRTTKKYGDRGERYVYMEAGHAAQNIYLQAVPLGVGTVTVGAFSDSAVSRNLELPRNCVPLYLMPVGKSE